MTLPEGREPLLWRDLEFAEARGHPSTWEIECKQLRARVAELEAALTRIKNYTGHPTAISQAERNVFAWASQALEN